VKGKKALLNSLGRKKKMKEASVGCLNTMSGS
jgi:hypothetical protein